MDSFPVPPAGAFKSSLALPNTRSLELCRWMKVVCKCDIFLNPFNWTESNKLPADPVILPSPSHVGLCWWLLRCGWRVSIFCCNQFSTWKYMRDWLQTWLLKFVALFHVQGHGCATRRRLDTSPHLCFAYVHHFGTQPAHETWTQCTNVWNRQISTHNTWVSSIKWSTYLRDNFLWPRSECHHQRRTPGNSIFGRTSCDYDRQTVFWHRRTRTAWSANTEKNQIVTLRDACALGAPRANAFFNEYLKHTIYVEPFRCSQKRLWRLSVGIPKKKKM